jgi:hypothetical protein
LRFFFVSSFFSQSPLSLPEQTPILVKRIEADAGHKEKEPELNAGQTRPRPASNIFSPVFVNELPL